MVRVYALPGEAELLARCHGFLAPDGPYHKMQSSAETLAKRMTPYLEPTLPSTGALEYYRLHLDDFITPMNKSVLEQVPLNIRAEIMIYAHQRNMMERLIGHYGLSGELKNGVPMAVQSRMLQWDHQTPVRNREEMVRGVCTVLAKADGLSQLADTPYAELLPVYCKETAQQAYQRLHREIRTWVTLKADELLPQDAEKIHAALTKFGEAAQGYDTFLDQARAHFAQHGIAIKPLIYPGARSR